MVLIRTMTGNGKEGRERRDFSRVRSMWQLQTVWGQGSQKKSQFPVQITQYGCELRSANEDRELSLGSIVLNDRKTFIQEEAGSFSPTCEKITQTPLGTHEEFKVSPLGHRRIPRPFSLAVQPLHRWPLLLGSFLPLPVFSSSLSPFPRTAFPDSPV